MLILRNINDILLGVSSKGDACVLVVYLFEIAFKVILWSGGGRIEGEVVAA